MKTLVNILLLVLFCACAEAKTLYVDSATGSDATTYANNSAQAPWATLGRAAWGHANRSTPNVNEAAQAGDTVIVRAGTYSADGTDSRMIPAFNPVNSGTAGNPITFRAEGTVTLELTSLTGPTIGGYQVSYIVWDGFRIDEANATYHADTGVITIFFADNITIRNCEVIGINSSVIDNHNGIRVEEAADIILENNKIHGVKRTDDSHNAAGIMVYFTDGIVIRNNEVYDNIAGIFPKGGDNTGVYIYDNLVYGNVKGLRTSYTLSGAAYRNVIRDNTMGIQIAENTQDFTFANNTLDGNYYGMFVNVATNWSGNAFQNNIITASEAAVWVEDTPTITGLALDHNAYYSFNRFRIAGSNRTLAQWQSYTGEDDNSTEIDPEYVDSAQDNFRLQPGSGVMDAGVDLLDLDSDASTVDPITLGAYITGSEIIGVVPASSPGRTIRKFKKRFRRDR